MNANQENSFVDNWAEHVTKVLNSELFFYALTSFISKNYHLSESHVIHNTIKFTQKVITERDDMKSQCRRKDLGKQSTRVSHYNKEWSDNQPPQLTTHMLINQGLHRHGITIFHHNVVEGTVYPVSTIEDVERIHALILWSDCYQWGRPCCALVQTVMTWLWMTRVTMNAKIWSHEPDRLRH